MLNIMEKGRIGMELYGLLGKKLNHSLSPEIHAEIFKNLKIEGHYHLFEVEKKDLKDVVKGLKALKIRGVNVTIPYKVAIIEFLEEISREARKIGAVNTICFEDDKAIGYNTDYYGFSKILEKHKIEVKNKKIVVLGTGGASKAVLQYLIDENAGEITVVSRDTAKAKKRLQSFHIIDYEKLKNSSFKDIIINCTPCGMYPNVNESVIERKILSKFQTAIDLIYNPKETLFLKYAKLEGLNTANGLYMLVGQAIKAQELWNHRILEPFIEDQIYKKLSTKF
ncbi:shikimate dehydrogenase [Garciella nitratireducens]|uniref:Shikimate dehydrogenase (NADP(+)) n=1 Tax=Garciella nitratireducens DSM 15102 TaxID=1121911 RepID=A0A1T4N2A4_9FIRM|nr:shikimate dehydrogenase [Garciella nitratireducens]SJZ73251.1 shikimate dehydrogenase [Garciella nitratireducens DSM 15102]